MKEFKRNYAVVPDTVNNWIRIEKSFILLVYKKCKAMLTQVLQCHQIVAEVADFFR